MTFLKKGDLVWIKLNDHTHNFGKLMKCEVAGFYSHEDHESITLDSWSTSNSEAQQESFTIAWDCVTDCWLISLE